MFFFYTISLFIAIRIIQVECKWYFRLEVENNEHLNKLIESAKCETNQFVDFRTITTCERIEIDFCVTNVNALFPNKLRKISCDYWEKRTLLENVSKLSSFHIKFPTKLKINTPIAISIKVYRTHHRFLQSNYRKLIDEYKWIDANSNNRLNNYNYVQLPKIHLTLKGQRRCSTYFYGKQCSNYCRSSLLSNYECEEATGKRVCKSGWKGKQCEVAECKCQNGGQCLHFNHCTCPKSFTGKYCEVCIPNDKRCRGICSTDPGKCHCEHHQYGKFCEFSIMNEEDNRNINHVLNQLHNTIKSSSTVSPLTTTTSTETSTITPIPIRIISTKQRTYLPTIKIYPSKWNMKNNKEKKETAKTNLLSMLYNRNDRNILAIVVIICITIIVPVLIILIGFIIYQQLQLKKNRYPSLYSKNYTYPITDEFIVNENDRFQKTKHFNKDESVIVNPGNLYADNDVYETISFKK
ncbi:hypothetical protein SNEBB_002047 [Seison nebaliae]|nr:hypothetical protein SNEBB_002047 [Seison nebaliae]